MKNLKNTFKILLFATICLTASANGTKPEKKTLDISCTPVNRKVLQKYLVNYPNLQKFRLGNNVINRKLLNLLLERTSFKDSEAIDEFITEIKTSTETNTECFNICKELDSYIESTLQENAFGV